MVALVLLVTKTWFGHSFPTQLCFAFLTGSLLITKSGSLHVV